MSLIAAFADPVPFEWVCVVTGALTVWALRLWDELLRTREEHAKNYSALERRTDDWREAQNEFRTTAIELLRVVTDELKDIRRRLEP